MPKNSLFQNTNPNRLHPGLIFPHSVLTSFALLKAGSQRHRATRSHMSCPSSTAFSHTAPSASPKVCKSTQFSCWKSVSGFKLKPKKYINKSPLQRVQICQETLSLPQITWSSSAKSLWTGCATPASRKGAGRPRGDSSRGRDRARWAARLRVPLVRRHWSHSWSDCLGKVNTVGWDTDEVVTCSLLFWLFNPAE